jgi:hypothetical protein
MISSGPVRRLQVHFILGTRDLQEVAQWFRV